MKKTERDWMCEWYCVWYPPNVMNFNADTNHLTNNWSKTFPISKEDDAFRVIRSLCTPNLFNFEF